MKYNIMNSKPLELPPVLFVLLILVFAPSMCECSPSTYAYPINMACCAVCTAVISMERRLTVARLLFSFK
jgi:hypothetical protein